MWGYRATAGDSVGGGLFTSVRLASDEQVVLVCVATHSERGWFDRRGYLVLTDRRLVHTSYRWPASILASKPTITTCDMIASVRTERRREPDRPESFLIDALIVATNAGREEIFWPAGDAHAIANEIDRLLRR